MRIRSLAFCSLFFYLLILIQPASASGADDACDIPQPLQQVIANVYPAAKLVTLSDLSEEDKGFFQKDHGGACPGVVKVNFYGDNKPTLVLVLIDKHGTKQRAQLILAHKVEERWKIKLLDTTDATPVPVVWSQPPAKYDDVHGNKSIRAMRAVVVFAGYESWQILYAWTGKRIAKIWLQD